jgi:hypothetical protein
MASFFDKYLTPISVGFPPVGLSFENPLTVGNQAASLGVSLTV